MAALIETSGLIRDFHRGRSVAELMRGERPVLRAVDSTDIAIGSGDSVGLVGESGCGKTTLGRLLLKLLPPSAGVIRFRGETLATMDTARTRRFRSEAQLVFQNPYEAVNPRFTVRRALIEPLANTGVRRAEHAERIEAALRLVRLGDLARTLDSYPHQLSGGQLQRVVLARALVVQPSFLVADEPVSMLDVSVRAGVLNLLREVRERMGLTALTISHDLALVRSLCARTLVMYLGRIVEDGPTERVIRSPVHPYTQALIAAVPRPVVDQPRGPLPISGAITSGRTLLRGCRLRERCPHAFARCAEEDPPLVEVAPGHRAACHLHGVSA